MKSSKKKLLQAYLEEIEIARQQPDNHPFLSGTASLKVRVKYLKKLLKLI